MMVKLVIEGVTSLDLYEIPDDLPAEVREYFLDYVKLHVVNANMINVIKDLITLFMST